MRLAIFGLTVTSSWANGHATTWRGLLRALRRAGHQMTFFERDVPYYAAARDLPDPEFCDLVLYREWEDVLPRARAEIAAADAAVVTSYCADGVAAGDLVLGGARGLRVFYDIDTPITLADLSQHGFASSAGVRYLERRQIPEFDLYLTFTGGGVLRLLEDRYGARRAAPLYCSVDPELHRRPASAPAARFDLGYLGTYAADRQPGLHRLLLEPARRRPQLRFRVAGSQYPEAIEWPANVQRVEHLPPEHHAAFYAAGRVTLNLTRAAMLEQGYSPSVRLFEAAACGAPILTDRWPGLEDFFAPGEEILVADTTEDALAALDTDDAALARIAAAARERVLAEHTAQVRAHELVELISAPVRGEVARR